MIKIYDTMSRDLREFVPIEDGKVKMYVCGPTVYNYIHVGNARSTVAFDTIRRYFEYRGYKVNYISNFTDVDDKIINRAKEEGITPQEVADKYIAAFREDVTALGVKPATRHPRVVEFMADIIRFVSDLIEKGYAYESQGDVYFRVEKSHNYAKLANKTLEDLELGASGRTDEETARKENPVDFALWKAAKPGEISWDSPWGPGRPGWHIECSVMSTKLLGDTIDIHGGGADLEFPHHTNEIAQSEAKTGKTFANYWMHNGFVNIDNVKMSKSLGNFITVHDALKTTDGQVLRFFFATQHYRKPINFTEKSVSDAETNLKHLKNIYEQPFSGTVDTQELQAFKDKFVAAMDEDFNTANGITVVFEMAKWIKSGHYNQKVKDTLTKMLEVFGIDLKKTKKAKKTNYNEELNELYTTLLSEKLKGYYLSKFDRERILEYLKYHYHDEYKVITISSSHSVHIRDKFMKAISNKCLPSSVLMIVNGNQNPGVLKALRDCEEVSFRMGIKFDYQFIYNVNEKQIKLIQKRQEARANRDFATADQIRDQLAAQGIKLLDTKDGVRWTRD